MYSQTPLHVYGKITFTAVGIETLRLAWDIKTGAFVASERHVSAQRAMHIVVVSNTAVPGSKKV